jgi:hypothetical protein
VQESKSNEVGAAESKNWERTLYIFVAISSACILGWLLKYSHYGIDFTDESFYLVWISNPFIYNWSVYLFGFLYYPLYQLLDGSIAALRQANILITFSLAWLLVNIFLKVIVLDASSGWLQRLVISSGFATASLVFLYTWLPTPSYNSLALQALLIVATGLLLAETTPSRSSVLGWGLIGLGGWLAFMAKPSTAAALTVCVGSYLLLARKMNIRLFLLATTTALILLIFSALAIDGSFIKFINRIKVGVEYLGYQDGGYTFGEILRLDGFRLNWREKLVLTSMALFSFLAARFTYSQRQSIKFIGRILSVLFFSAVLIITLEVAHNSIGFRKFQGLIIWAIPISAAALGLVSCRDELFFKISISHWMLVLVFIVFPHIYAFGTNVNYWQAGSSAGVFWLLSGLVLISPIARSENKQMVLPPLALATQVIVVLLVQTGMEEPYRQTQALRLNSHPVEIGRPGSVLVLSDGYASYIGEAKTLAKQAGFEAGTPMIDLSGQSPGVLFALNAKNIGRAWTIGGYPGSLKLAIASLIRVSCEEIGNAWLIAEPNGPRSIPDELVATFGANLAEHYEPVATWKTAVGAGGYRERRLQILLKPVRVKSVAVHACNSKRAENSK